MLKMERLANYEQSIRLKLESFVRDTCTHNSTTPLPFTISTLVWDLLKHFCNAGVHWLDVSHMTGFFREGILFISAISFFLSLILWTTGSNIFSEKKIKLAIQPNKLSFFNLWFRLLFLHSGAKSPFWNTWKPSQIKLELAESNCTRLRN